MLHSGDAPDRWPLRRCARARRIQLRQSQTFRMCDVVCVHPRQEAAPGDNAGLTQGGNNTAMRRRQHLDARVLSGQRFHELQ